MFDHEDKFSLFDNCLGLVIARAGKLLLSDMDCAARSLNITNVQLGVLLVIMGDASATVRRIGDLLGVDSGTVSRSLDGLEQQGLISRLRSSVDRRLINLSLTAPGRDISARIPELLLSQFNDRFKALTKKEHVQLHRLLRKCIVD